MLADVRDRPVLCLAGGGGQQSAFYSLLGATVTVLDLTPEQLERDRMAAAHYGYEVTTIEGDMRDISDLPDRHYARVCQPISTLYVPDLRQVYRGVARVLAPGGLYFSQYVNTALYMAEDLGWDGVGYLRRFSQPHRRGPVLERASDSVMNFEEGVSFGEFNHLLSDIINGLIAEGLIVQGLWESPRPDPGPVGEHDPGTDGHRDSIIPFGLSVIAMKPS